MEPLEQDFCDVCRSEKVIHFQELHFTYAQLKQRQTAYPSVTDRTYPCPRCKPVDFAKWREAERREWFRKVEFGLIAPTVPLPHFLL